MAEQTFKSLTRMTDSFDSKKGKEFRGDLRSFIGKDAVVSPAGNSFVVRTFVNISGVTDEINDKLGTEFVEDAEFKNITGNVSVFTRTEAEADELVKLWTKGKQIAAPVRVSSHEYDGKHFLDMVVETASVFEKDGAKASKNEDADLPI